MACCLCLNAYDLAGPRASGNVRHADMQRCCVIVETICVSVVVSAVAT